jgi:hypothetical protein
MGAHDRFMVFHIGVAGYASVQQEYLLSWT